MDEIMAVVYKHYNKQGLLFYIGVSINDNRPHSTNSRNEVWQKCAKSGFTVELSDKLPHAEAIILERKLIDEFKPMANLKRGGNTGAKPIEDKKIKLTIYVRQSVIDRVGGIEAAKSIVIKAITNIENTKLTLCTP